jgi:AmiR/NasT family two-component response regulator
MPVIEQAKGILIAQTGCSPDEAFTLLRQASQRSNVRVSELAASMVDRAVTKGLVPSRPARAQPPPD